MIGLGDSLTQRAEAEGGWMGLLRDSLSRRGDVLNRGFSGYNSRQLLFVLDQFIQNGTWPSSDVVLLCIGANDASKHHPQHIGIEEYKKNVRDIIERLEGITRLIVLITPPTLHEESYNEYCEENDKERYSRENKVTQIYANACGEIAKEEDILFCDMFKAFENTSAEYFSDGLHFSLKGNQMFFHTISAVLEREWKIASFPIDAPLWTDLDPEDLETSYHKAPAFLQ